MKENKRKIIRTAVIILIAYLFVKLIMSFKQETSINKLTVSTKLISTEIVKLTSNMIKVPVYGKLQAVNTFDVISETNGVFFGENFKTGMQFNSGDTLGFTKYSQVENNLNSRKSVLLNQISRLVSEIKFDYPNSYEIWLDFMNNIQFNKPLPKMPEIKSIQLRNYLSGKNFYTTYYAAKVLEEELNKHIITSSFNGVLSEVSITSGTPVTLGQKIGNFQDPKNLEFESSTNIKNTLMLKKNQTVILYSDDVNGQWKGSVSRINKTINPSSQNMSVFIKVKNNNVFSGMYVYGDVLIGENQKSFSIKRSLLNKNKVFVVIDSKLFEKEIEILQINEENAIISGLKDGDRLLKDPIKGSFSGMKIRTK
jgi:membrane fusion protein (multidrug efflux system)